MALLDGLRMDGWVAVVTGSGQGIGRAIAWGLADAGCFATVDPHGFLLGELDGAPAATISCVNYDERFAYGALVPALATARFDVTGNGGAPGI